jgi:16S rRNA A1518/A1519 N6-dimethyltransferase RsmA/KsgA/DIM1 with predicted DNA glycosylase/AP lyase activity
MPLDQHFLTSMDVVEKLVKAVNVVREDAVVDVGAGRGAITAALAERAGAVYAVESDRRLLPYLNAVAHIHPNVKVFHGNFLTLRLPHYTKVVANPPFSILEPMIQMHIDRPLPMSLLTPAHFAEKLASTTPNTLLAYVVQLVYRGEVVETYPGSVLDPAYPGKVAHILLEPKKPRHTDRYMIKFLQQRGSKVRNALRNILWKHMHKREATRLVELSELPDNILDKRVARITLEEARAIHRFIHESLAERFMFKNDYEQKPFDEH